VKFEEEKLIEFFKKPQTSVIEIPPDKKDIVFKHAERGTVYTSKQTSAGDIYKFENDDFYVCWQVKYGKSRSFGPVQWCIEVKKAILHKCDDHIKFVLVIVAQKLASFFSDPKKIGSENVEFIKDGDKCLAVQFNPGYKMHVDRKTKRTPEGRKETTQKGKSNTTKKRKVEESQKFSEYEVPKGVQVIVLFNAGTKQLLGNPIGNFLDDPIDTAVTCALDEFLPDPMFMDEPITIESNEESDMEFSDDEDRFKG